MRRRRLPKQHASQEHLEREARRVEATFRQKREEAQETFEEAARPLHGVQERTPRDRAS